MAKKSKKNGESLSAYFRKIFTDHPEWVEQKSNNVVLDQYRIDHGLAPDAEVGKSVKDAMANTKSISRKRLRGDETPNTTVGKKRGRKPGVAVPATAASKPTLPAHGKGSLEALEIKIDECLTMARLLQIDTLGGVIRALRYARNKVVYLSGEPTD